MNTTIIRQLWAVVEESSAKTLINLDDSDLVSQLLKKLDAKQPLSDEDKNLVSVYVSSRTLLIREMAESRLEDFLDWAFI